MCPCVSTLRVPSPGSNQRKTSFFTFEVSCSWRAQHLLAQHLLAQHFKHFVRVGSLSSWRGADLTLAPAILSTFLYLLDSSCSLRNPFCMTSCWIALVVAWCIFFGGSLHRDPVRSWEGACIGLLWVPWKDAWTGISWVLGKDPCSEVLSLPLDRDPLQGPCE